MTTTEDESKWLRGYAYLRLCNDGASIETQQREIERHCRSSKIRLDHCYVDIGISGKNIDDRPQLKALLEKITDNDRVLIYNLSRLSQNMKNAVQLFEELKVKKACLICLLPNIDFSTPVGEASYVIISALVQLEGKTKVSKDSQLRSRPPFGWKKADSPEWKSLPFEPHPAQQAVIDIIRSKFVEERLSTSELVHYLNTNGYNSVLGINTKKNAPRLFYAETVRRILADSKLISTDRKDISLRIVPRS